MLLGVTGGSSQQTTIESFTEGALPLQNCESDESKTQSLQSHALPPICWVRPSGWRFESCTEQCFDQCLVACFTQQMRINDAVTIPRFHPWNRLAINKLNEQQLTDLLAVDYLTSSVEKCVEITLEVKRKYQQKLVRQVTECPINKSPQTE